MADKNMREKEDKAFEEMKHAGKQLQENRQDNQDIPQGRNRLWGWLGVRILIFILIYWLFDIGTFCELSNWLNG